MRRDGQSPPAWEEGVDAMLPMREAFKQGKGASQRPCGWRVGWGRQSCHRDREPREIVELKPEGEEVGTQAEGLGADSRDTPPLKDGSADWEQEGVDP